MLRSFENRVLRRTFGPRTGEVIGDWRKFRNQELNNSSIRNEDEVGRACSTHEIDEKCIQNFGPESGMEETALKSSPKWEENVKMDLEKEW
jgi:hypothetical protein